MDDVTRQMGFRIMLCRKNLKLTQEQLAELAGVTPQTISSAERGRKALRPENIVRISRALHTTPNFLLLGQNPDSDDILHNASKHLTPEQRVHLGNIIQEFIEAISYDT